MKAKTTRERTTKERDMSFNDVRRIKARNIFFVQMWEIMQDHIAQDLLTKNDFIFVLALLRHKIP